MDRTPILDIKIEANGPAVHMKGENAEVLMVPFKGSADCAIFRGIVEPCGVDTQVVNAAGVRHMSARYLMTGMDAEGQPCHIYVENNGWFDDATKTMPFRTVPTFYTDSKALAPYLHRGQFTGEGHDMADGLHILFFEIGDKGTTGGEEPEGSGEQTGGNGPEAAEEQMGENGPEAAGEQTGESGPEAAGEQTGESGPKSAEEQTGREEQA